MNLLTIDIGGTKFTAALFEQAPNQQPRIIRRESRTTHREGGREWLLNEMTTLLPSLTDGKRLSACGVGFGGPVDFTTQRVALSTHVSGWSGFPLRDHLQDQLHIPVIIDKDANVGALGEAKFGAGNDATDIQRPLFYMTLSTGIGGGIILNDDVIYRGADSWAGEIGHVTIRPDGPECLCGARGCLERLCSGLWLERDHQRSAQQLLQDPAFVRKYVVDLAQGIKTVVMLLNPAQVIIGGGIAKAGDALFTPLRIELRRQVTGWSGARVNVQQAALGDDSVLWGAFALAQPLTK